MALNEGVAQTAAEATTIELIVGWTSIVGGWASIVCALAIVFETYRWLSRRVRVAAERAEREFLDEIEKLERSGGTAGGRADLGFFVQLEVSVQRNAIGQYWSFGIVFAVLFMGMMNLYMWASFAQAPSDLIYYLIASGALLAGGASINSIVSACRARASLDAYVRRVQGIWRAAIEKRVT